jgi:FAD/FMN-containing dehydrogenase
MFISEDPTLTALESFLSKHPAIKYATPTSPNYASLRAIYNLDNISSPLAIVRPQNAENVAAIVKYATSQGINFVVRSGGGNVFGKSQVQGAITIDMRDINFVEVEQHKTSAKVGGGVLMGDLSTALDKEGLATAVGTIPFVGFIGWAVYGGKKDIPWSSSPKHPFSILRTKFKTHLTTLSKS